jgi:uncharacterized glyoxalase superfamily protein PhnB
MKSRTHDLLLVRWPYRNAIKAGSVRRAGVRYSRELAMSKCRIVPTMRYRDARGMIEWLGKAFGFEPHLIVEDRAGGIAHAQLVLGDSMIMLGSHRDDEFGRLQSPAIPDFPVTQSPYIIVDDPDAMHERVRRARAEIVMPLKDEDYGGRGFSARDPEGQLWNFGSYDPWNTDSS